MELNLDLRKQAQLILKKTQTFIFPNAFSIISQLLAHFLKKKPWSVADENMNFIQHIKRKTSSDFWMFLSNSLFQSFMVFAAINGELPKHIL